MNTDPNHPNKVSYPLFMIQTLSFRRRETPDVLLEKQPERLLKL